MAEWLCFNPPINKTSKDNEHGCSLAVLAAPNPPSGFSISVQVF
jgi:hypothetical protein